MIHVVKEKCLNDFKSVVCIKPKDLYSRLGHRTPNTDFNSSDEAVPMSMNKIDAIEYMDAYDSMMQEQSNRANDESANRDSQNNDSSGES